MKIVSIIPHRLYAGGELDTPGWKFVQEKVHAVLNLRPVQDHPPFCFLNRMLIWAPLLSHLSPELPWIIGMTRQIRVLLDSGFVLYVHDVDGINRLGFVLTAFFMDHFQMTRDQALSAVRCRKPDISPNKQFTELLGEYEVYLREDAKGTLHRSENIGFSHR